MRRPSPGPLAGGQFLPVVFPVNIADCEVNGDLGVSEADWEMSQPGNPPIGQEYIVPLCKTGGGSFMILDLDGTPNNCDDEVTNPPAIQFATFPADVASDNGNNCAKRDGRRGQRPQRQGRPDPDLRRRRASPVMAATPSTTSSG